METPELPGDDLEVTPTGDGLYLFFHPTNPHAWTVGPAVDVATVR